MVPAPLESLLRDASLGLPAEQAAALIEQGRTRGKLAIEDVITSGAVTEAALLQRATELLGLCYSELGAEAIAEEAIRAVPPAMATRYAAMPVSLEDGQLVLAVSDPFDVAKIDEMSLVLRRRLRLVLATRANIQKAIRRHYGVGAATVDSLMANGDSYGQAGQDAVQADAGEAGVWDASVGSLVNQILVDAIRERATDIHLEPYEAQLRVRYRIDGMLVEAALPARVAPLREAIVNRIKVMANLDIAEKRLPQDGRAQLKVGQEEYDLRLSMLPTPYGETVNIRILTRQFVFGDPSDLGFSEAEGRQIETLTGKPHGMILVTGPTGSGKTTTLYTCLERLNRPHMKILTIEDPIEYRIQGISQLQVNPAIDFTFARGLRSIFRHDPDVILVGEIRDPETAEIAIRAALTGHLVFSTLHTNDAPGAIPRMLDMGIEPYLLASSIEGIIAQRLVRTICPHCRDECAPGEDVLERVRKMGTDPREVRFVRGKGCKACRFQGYQGRTTIGSILVMDAELRELVMQRADADRIGQAACRKGMVTLAEVGWRKVVAGITTPEEVWRVAKD
jgi:type II secretory ATPase GspE/PulE/Tfp pilus assembly ATPase PilB-like protein